MKNILIIILITFTISLSAQGRKTHTVVAGETIESIAKQYLVTPFDIYALNPDDTKANFKSGMVLIIPVSKVKNEAIEKEVKELIGYKKHKVRRKETLYSISKKYNVSIDDIKKANRSLYSENLRKGDRIQIPEFKTIISKQTLNNTVKKYTVLPKEGKWRIAYKFGITVAELEALNPSMHTIIQPGDVLNVPNILDEEEKPTETAYSYYEVLPKEGFFRLKVKLGLTQDELETLNPELKETGLKLGMVLKIPLSTKTSEVSSAVKTTNLENNIVNFNTKKVALLMPFKLNTIDATAVEETKSKIRDEMLLSVVLDFHAGALMAIDYAKYLGISTHLKVFDTRYNAATTRDLLEANNFSDYDAVIGAVEIESIDRIAKALKPHKVPLVVPLSKPREVYNNVFQTIPEDKLLRKTMIDFIKSDSLKSQVVIISDQSKRPVSNVLKKEFPSAVQIFSRKDMKKNKDGYFLYPTDLKNVFKPGKTVVFLETENSSLASSVISMLNALITNRTEIVLVTLDKNKAFSSKNIDNNNLSNLKFHYPSIDREFDYENPNSFVKNYRNEYGVSPSRFAVRGFDLTLDILLRLAFKDDLYKASDNTIETEYVENKFRYNTSLFGGYVNEAVYIVKYDNLKIVKAN